MYAQIFDYRPRIYSHTIGIDLKHHAARAVYHLHNRYSIFGLREDVEYDVFYEIINQLEVKIIYSIKCPGIFHALGRQSKTSFRITCLAFFVITLRSAFNVNGFFISFLGR